MIFYLETAYFFWLKSAGVAVAATQADRHSTAMIPRKKTHSSLATSARHSGTAVKIPT